jgi:hypothetical protein
MTLRFEERTRSDMLSETAQSLRGLVRAQAARPACPPAARRSALAWVRHKEQVEEVKTSIRMFEHYLRTGMDELRDEVLECIDLMERDETDGYPDEILLDALAQLRREVISAAFPDMSAPAVEIASQLWADGTGPGEAVETGRLVIR